jgi:hypothetical protein
VSALLFSSRHGESCLNKIALCLRALASFVVTKRLVYHEGREEHEGIGTTQVVPPVGIRLVEGRFSSSSTVDKADITVISSSSTVDIADFAVIWGSSTVDKADITVISSSSTVDIADFAVIWGSSTVDIVDFTVISSSSTVDMAENRVITGLLSMDII